MRLPIGNIGIVSAPPKAQKSVEKGEQKESKSQRWWLNAKTQCIYECTATVTVCGASLQVHARPNPSMKKAFGHGVSCLAKKLWATVSSVERKGRFL